MLSSKRDWIDRQLDILEDKVREVLVVTVVVVVVVTVVVIIVVVIIVVFHNLILK